MPSSHGTRLDREQHEHADQLQDAAACARPCSETSATVARALGRRSASSRSAKSRSAPVLVDVGDGDRRMLDAQHRDQLGGRQRRAAEREEVAVGADRDRPELLAPVLRQPPLGLGQLARRRPASGGGHGSALRSTLPDVATGQLVEHHDHRDEARRHPLGDVGAHRLGLHRPGHVADEQLVAGGGLAHDRAGGAHAGHGVERVVELAELDPAPADLDLMVAAADELEAVVGQADDVAGAVGALPAQRGQAAVALGVEVGAQVAAEADAADHELAGLAGSDRPVVGVDDGEVPAAQRLADRHRLARDAAGWRSRRRWPRSARRCSTARACRRAARPAAPGTPRRRGSAGAPRRAPRRPRSRPASARSR